MIVLSSVRLVSDYYLYCTVMFLKCTEFEMQRGRVANIFPKKVAHSLSLVVPEAIDNK